MSSFAVAVQFPVSDRCRMQMQLPESENTFKLAMVENSRLLLEFRW